MRMLAYGTLADLQDEYLKIKESIAVEALGEFCTTVIRFYSDVYLKHPTVGDVKNLLQLQERQHEFPGMFGSIDCMHQGWKNCPVALKAQYQNRKKEAAIILEAVASHDSWIWYAYFGLPGSLNDINILNRSPIFKEHTDGKSPFVSDKVNDNDYDLPDYLADGIYPKYATFVKRISAPHNAKEKVIHIHHY